MNPPYKNPNLPIKKRIENLLSQMTLAEKIGQMTQVEKNSLNPADVTEYFIGSVLSGGGGNPSPNTPQNWADMVRSFAEPALKTRLGIPLIYGVDAVHGHNNMRGAVIFPHNIGLGATRDSALVEKIGRVIATETIATGVHWDFAPTVAVPKDLRWGRTYEGFSDQTDLVSEMGVALTKGLQNANGKRDLAHPRTVLASVKHYVGDGAAKWGSANHEQWMVDKSPYRTGNEAIDQGVSDIDEATLRAEHLPPYQAAIEAGALNIMVSYTSWGGLKMHEHKYLLTDVLKKEFGFEGFLVSDWKAIYQLYPDTYACVVASINAGLDMIMVPYDFKGFINDLTQAVTQGDIAMARIDDAVSRILLTKFELGLFENPLGDDSLLATVGCAEHRDIAREAVRKSLVLLKNERQTLPLAKDIPSIYVAGQAADNIGLQCGGWTIEWMGGSGPITPGTTILQGLKQTAANSAAIHYDPAGDFNNQAEVGLVVLSEIPYAEGTGDRTDLNLPAEDIALIEKMRTKCQKLVIILLSGRPLIITEQLEKCDAFIAAWLPGTEGDGLAQVIFGDYPFSGKLSYNWPRSMAQVGQPYSKTSQPLFPFGYGL